MKRTLLALIMVLVLLSGGAVGQTAALLGGSFEVTGTAATEDFGAVYGFEVTTEDGATVPGRIALGALIILLLMPWLLSKPKTKNEASDGPPPTTEPEEASA